MSRIGKTPIEIPAGVTVEVNGNTVSVKGPKGELKIEFRPEIGVKVEEGKIITYVVSETKETNAYWGLTRSLIANMVKGVTKEFEKELELVGVGYRVKPSGNGISLTVGFSHPVEFIPEKGITLEVDGNTKIIVKGVDKQLVGLTAAKIRKIRKPEPYKGKGIKYVTEVVRRKAGKAGKA